MEERSTYAHHLSHLVDASLEHELPNSTSNINDTHEAYFHFENK